MWKQQQLEFQKKKALKHDTELFHKICKNRVLNPPKQIPPMKLLLKTRVPGTPTQTQTITTTIFYSPNRILEHLSSQLQVEQHTISFTLSEVLVEEGMWFPSVECLSFIPTKTAIVFVGEKPFRFSSKHLSPREAIWELAADPTSLISLLPPEILKMISNYSIEVPLILSVAEKQWRDTHWDEIGKYRWVKITLRALINQPEQVYDEEKMFRSLKPMLFGNRHIVQGSAIWKIISPSLLSQEIYVVPH
jgi:hypothetical protein